MRRRKEARPSASEGQLGSQGARKSREALRSSAQACQSPRSGGRSITRSPMTRSGGGCRLKRRGSCSSSEAVARGDGRLSRKARTDAIEMLEAADLAERGEGWPTRGDAPGNALHRLVVDGFDTRHDIGDVEELVIDEKLLRQLLAARRGALQRHEDAGLELRPRALQLGGAEPVADAPDLIAHGRHQLGDLLGPGAGIDAEEAGVAIAMREGIDGIDEATLLADLLKEPRGHAAAQRRRQHRGGVVVGILVGEAGKAQHDMHLLEVALLAPVAADIDGGLGARGALMRQAGEGARRMVGERLGIDLAGGGEHHARRRIVLAEISGDAVARHALDDLRPAEDGPPHRLIGKGALLEEIEDDVVGRIVGLSDFLEDDGALAVELGRIEDRVLENVGEDVDRQRDILFQHLGVIGGVLARRVGVEMAADRLDLLGDGEGRAALGALERHVLQEMSNAVDVGRLVPRSDIDPDAERNRLDRIHPVGHDAKAARQGGEVNAHAAPPARRRRPSSTGRAWARTNSSTALRSFGNRVTRSCRSMRSARIGGSDGRMPVAASTASGNFAGWAQARATIGAPDCRAAMRAAATATALCGSRSSPLRRQVAAIVARVSSSSTRQEAKSRVASRHSAALAGKVPVARNARIAAATAAPSPPFSSKRKRSKLLDTWMSMLGLKEGSTVPIVMRPVAKKRARMSLRLVPMTSAATGKPMRRAICAA